jgi:effector-binding domain-containing protein
MTGSPSAVDEPTDGAPRIIERVEQRYAAVRCVVPMSSVNTVPARLDELMTWLARHEVEPDGPVFFRYELIDMDRELVIEVGVPVSREVPAAGDIVAGVLPGGSYASMTHVGHPDQLIDVTGRFLAWAEDAGVRWDAEETPAGIRWGCRLEIYLTDPAEQPDMNLWVTQLAFRVAALPVGLVKQGQDDESVSKA